MVNVVFSYLGAKYLLFMIIIHELSNEYMYLMIIYIYINIYVMYALKVVI